MIVGVAIKDSGGTVVALGKPARHHDVIKYMCDELGYASVPGDFEQGFMTDKGKFLTRKEAVDEAVACGQMKNPKWPPDLYSEDLW